MPLLPVGDSLTPTGNAVDVMVNGPHFHRPTLDHWNYTLYSNGTLSNGSHCWLVFDQYQPVLLANGTVVNATSCYSPINRIRGRGAFGIAFGALFALSVLFTLINLRKHGRMFLPDEKRWKIVGRRWQWYWMLFLTACGIISAITGVDVDRDYLQSTALILQSFFYSLMMPALLACVWESVRHWGSWQERQLCDIDAFSFPQHDYRSRKEFYMPLVFYVFDWLTFFVTIPRSWTAVQRQGSQYQIQHAARPAATDIRFKIGAIFALNAWCLVLYSLHHNIKCYRLRPYGSALTLVGFLQQAPVKYLLTVPLAALHVAYAVAAAWAWSISPLNISAPVGLLYGFGYGPILLIMVIYNIYGYLESNEDRALIAQRIERERATDAALGVGKASKKPPWWSKINGSGRSHGETSEQRLRALTTEIGGGLATGRHIRNAVEMGYMGGRSSSGGNASMDRLVERPPEDKSGSWWWEKRAEDAETSNGLSKDMTRKSPRYVRGSSLMESDEMMRESAQEGGSSTTSHRTEHDIPPLQQAEGQAIRSMLDL